jgi:ribosome-binding factor A
VIDQPGDARIVAPRLGNRMPALRAPCGGRTEGPASHRAEKKKLMKQPGQRQLRVGELIRHTVAELLARGDVHDPVLAGHLVTVPEVRMSPDLRLATIFVMPLGGRDEAQVIGALERNKRYMRGVIARRVNLKFAPDIRFRIDDRFDEAERIEKLLRSPAVKRDLGGGAGGQN